MPLNLAELNILIIDDEPDSINVVKLVCEYHGAWVRTSDLPTNCFQMLNEQIPDILFLDIQMPIKTGWDIIREIRNHQDFAHMIVIAMTAYAMEGDRQRVLDAGFTGYLSKPISPMSFLDDVEQIIRVKEKQE
jgi:CheY-like chemotaxis protein